MPAIRSVIDRIKASHLYRAWKRYGDANGDLLAAGVGYFAFFSVFPALALAFTVFGIVLRGRPDLLETIAESLNETLPGMVRTSGNPDGIIGLSAPQASTLTITGLVGLVTLLLAGLGWVSALRTGIRGVFGLEAAPGNAVKAKLRDLGVLLTLGLAIALSAVLTSAIGGLASTVAGWVGLGDNAVLVTVVGLLLGVAVDTVIMVVLLRMLSGVPLPWHNVRDGAIFGAVLLTVMKYFGGVLIERATSNPLLGAVAVAVGLLFWLNLMSRVVLLSAAWSANRVDLARLDDDGTVREVAPRRPAFAGPLRSGADASAIPYAAAAPADRQEVSGVAGSRTSSETPRASRSADRVGIAAGAVVGAAGAAGAAAVAAARRRRAADRR